MQKKRLFFLQNLVSQIQSKQCSACRVLSKILSVLLPKGCGLSLLPFSYKCPNLFLSQSPTSGPFGQWLIVSSDWTLHQICWRANLEEGTDVVST